MFVIKNPDKYQTNVSSENTNMRQIIDFIYNLQEYHQSKRLSAVPQ